MSLETKRAQPIELGRIADHMASVARHLAEIADHLHRHAPLCPLDDPDHQRDVRSDCISLELALCDSERLAARVEKDVLGADPCAPHQRPAAA